nr:EOG090X098P [Artemia franciscana]
MNVSLYLDVYLKIFSIILFIIVKVSVTIGVQYVRFRESDQFLSATAVVMTELIKAAVCFLVVLVQDKFNIVSFGRTVNEKIIKMPMDLLKLCLPAFISVIVNNLFFVGITNLDVVTYQITYQMKIFVAAVFTVFYLKRKISIRQWIALAILVIGVILAQLGLKSNTDYLAKDGKNTAIGFVAVVVACILSRFAGVYVEKILKEPGSLIFFINMQFSILSSFISLIICFIFDWKPIFDKGFFFGYDWVVWGIVCLQVMVGLLIPAVLKYADNIWRTIGASIAAILSSAVAIYVFDIHWTVQFIIGAVLVIISTFLYMDMPKRSKETQSETASKENGSVETGSTEERGSIV